MYSIAAMPMFDNIDDLQRWEQYIREIDLRKAQGPQKQQEAITATDDERLEWLANYGWDEDNFYAPPDDAQVPLGANEDDLAGYSANDAVWDVHKASNVHVRDLYEKFDGNEKHAQRMADCADWLSFYWAYRFEGGEMKHRLRLSAASFCHVRGCPICAWRRSLRMKALALSRLPDVMSEHPGYRFLFLTLTIKNCGIDELRDTMRMMSEGWARFRKRDVFAGVKGWFRVIEFTRGQDGVSVHPHYHVILHVPSTYFNSAYVKHSEWRQAWKEAMRLDYDPQVNIKAVKKGFEDGTIKEVMKYTTSIKADKLAEMIDTGDDWYVRLFEQIRGMKLCTSSGTLKGLASQVQGEDAEKDMDKDDLVHVGEGVKGEIIDDREAIDFSWRPDSMKYKRRKNK